MRIRHCLRSLAGARRETRGISEAGQTQQRPAVLRFAKSTSLGSAAAAARTGNRSRCRRGRNRRLCAVRRGWRRHARSRPPGAAQASRVQRRLAFSAGDQQACRTKPILRRTSWPEPARALEIDQLDSECARLQRAEGEPFRRRAACQSSRCRLWTRSSRGAACASRGPVWGPPRQLPPTRRPASRSRATVRAAGHAPCRRS